MKNTDAEGVIKFRLDFRQTVPVEYAGLDALEACRQRLRALGLIGGEDPARYEGLGFGNISHRLAPGSNAFVISGTQTGHLEAMGAEGYALVTNCDPENNQLEAHGAIRPSSEAMTHAVIYRELPSVQAVIHVHSPDIWRGADRIALPQTKREVPYGTPAMAAEMCRIIRSGMGRWHTISMAGHEDGVITWGDTLDMAAAELLSIYRRAAA